MTSETHKRGIGNQQQNWRRGRASKKDILLRGFGRVEKMFYYYTRIKKEIETIRAEQGFYPKSTLKEGAIGSGGGGGISDPTAKEAIKHTEPIKQISIPINKYHSETINNPESWAKVVEQTIAYFGEKHLTTVVLKHRFFKNEPMRKTCTSLEITERQYYKARDRGIEYARECAIQLGLITVF